MANRGPLRQENCPECDRLISEHGLLKQIYMTALQARIECRADTPASEYIKLRIAAEEAWLDAESARLAVEQYRRGHVNAMMI
jgi:hypothetical protein